MMCDECGVNPASIRITTIMGGEKMEKNLCASCMASYQKQMPHVDFSSLASLLSGFFESIKAQDMEKAEVPDIRCSNCGRSFAQFQKSGLMGCANCYHDFRQPLESILSSIHGRTQHAGRVPAGMETGLTAKLKIDQLKQKLVKAIADEEYEDAASLRDQIRMLTAELNKAKDQHAVGGEDHA